ncbi:MAG: hypothetical protein KZQ85_09165 [Candidatus Thiodiazotropha sp. (ex Myrtea sp. 'scaly one' KF741663)]|nr:hypothetical protein [Candidatus Thiodiazotropha sp. (ex Myrtea sp. 'scaly one' KF741663)]
MRCSLLVCSAMFLTATSANADYPVAGKEPSQRPSDAPVIEWVNHNKAWYQSALTGVQQPYPRSLYFLDNQGNWYTPFIHPGMKGRYDLRNWHQ